MMRRRGGLIATAARTAVIAGTAQATSNAVNRRAYERQAQGQEQAAPEAAPAVQEAPVQYAQPAPAAGGDDIVSQLEKLASLKAAGLLSDADFEAAKAKLLG